MGYSIRRIKTHNVKALIPLGKEAENEGFDFVSRTVKEYQSGENDFTCIGEALYGVFENDACIGVCGLNIDPYTKDPGVGRLRHLYVRPGERMMGVGKLLITKLIEEAVGTFSVLRLKSTQMAMEFYDRMGFERHEGKHESHRMILGKEK